MDKLDLLIPTIPHRHAELCALLEELDRQMLPDIRVSIFRDNLDASYGDKCGALVKASDAQYVAFLDDDDWVAGDYLKSVMHALECEPDYVGWTEIYTVNDSPPMLIVHSLENRRAQFPDAVTHSGIVHKNPIRREYALLGEWTGGWGADGHWSDTVTATGKVRSESWIDHPVYFYRWNTGNEFRTARKPLPPPFPSLPKYPWLREIMRFTEFEYDSWGSVDKYPGDTTTFEKCMWWLQETCESVEDWGCGVAHARKWLHPGVTYTGIDGSPQAARFADVQADLREYVSGKPDGILMRHVLEHNPSWWVILDNALLSFRRRMALVIFTPVGESRQLSQNEFFDLSFRREDLTARFEAAGLTWTEEHLETETQFGGETIFFLDRE